jgi:hypothetical protein
VAERYALGQATAEELATARAAAVDAQENASSVARVAVMAAENSVADITTENAAWTAAKLAMYETQIAGREAQAAWLRANTMPDFVKVNHE